LRVQFFAARQQKTKSPLRLASAFLPEGAPGQQKGRQ
jgi:hypothetical protein